jgi:hypothetical protein
MKLNIRSAIWRNTALQKSAVARFLSLTLLLLASTVRATIPEPDNVLYGSITLDNIPVTAAHSDVVVEARRNLDGPPVARYRMGSDPRAGAFYVLRIPIESMAETIAPDAAQSGEALFIVVTDVSGVRAQTTYTVEDRGQVLRVDFGVAMPDSDGNGLPDVWEIAHFGAIGQNPDAVNPNGQTTYENFITGADPNDPDSAFLLNIALSDNEQIVSFLARRAEGPGYEGMTRLYSLEFSPDPTDPSWEGITDLVPGNNQTVAFSITDADGPDFFRGRVVLEIAPE